VSARNHPRMVGAFVLGSVAIVLAAIVLLSSGGWFKTRDRFSIYFPGSVKGLSQGSAITFRGIKVGEVTDVNAFLTGKPDPLVQIEVVFEVRGRVIQAPGGVSNPFRGLTTAAFAKVLIDRGLRARLMSQSLLTGQKYVELDFLPEEPARFGGLSPLYPELPTTPTALEKLTGRFEDFTAKIAELPLDQMLEDVRGTLQSLRELLQSPGVQGTFTRADRALRTLQPTLEEARVAIADTRALVKNLDAQVKDTGGEVQQTMRELRATLDRTDRILGTLGKTLEGTDQTQLTATGALDELARTLKALRALVDYIETHPESLMLGKQQTKEKN